MNWGRSITIAFVLFAGFIGSMVYRAFTRDADLVRDDYYENELKFNDNKQKSENYAQLQEEFVVKHSKEGVQLIFPDPISESSKGNIHFYRPDKKSYDRNFDLSVDGNNQQLLDYSNFKEGYYDVIVEWEEKGTSYMAEKNISF